MGDVRTKKEPLLRDAGYTYNFDRMVYLNRATRKAFSVEWVEDNSEEELRLPDTRIRDPSLDPSLLLGPYEPQSLTASWAKPESGARLRSRTKTRSDRRIAYLMVSVGVGEGNDTTIDLGQSAA